MVSSDMLGAHAGKPLRCLVAALLGLLLACEEARPTRERPSADAGGTKTDAAFRDAGLADPDRDGANDGSGSDSSVFDAGVVMPGDCGSVPFGGRCLDDATLELCVAPSGGQVPSQPVSYSCQAGELCVASSAGAACVRVSDCVHGASACSDATTLRTCNAGSLQQQTCATGCRRNALGPSCAPQIMTSTFTGSLVYEARLPNADFTNWASATVDLPARRVLVVSYDGDEVIDAVYTADDGSFSVLVPQAKSADDVVAFGLLGGDDAGNLLYAVADPGFQPTALPRSAFDTPPDPNLWLFSYATEALTSGDTLRIPESAGSGALRVFDALSSAYELGKQHYHPGTLPTVLVWLGLGTRWDCGACAAVFPRQLSGTTFRHQLWLDGGSDQGYWSDAVTAHELGHFVMNAYGYPEAEGGPHFVGIPTHPGQAWSEGWATFFSSMQRRATRYYDKQGGAFFWFDLAQRSYGVEGIAWTRPSAGLGLLQHIDENEVAALVHGLYEAIGKEPILDAIASPRMTVPPFERRYTRRAWDDPERPQIYVRSDDPLPYHADFFDALRCTNAVSALSLDAVTEPLAHYPYPSASPLCR